MARTDHLRVQHERLLAPASEIDRMIKAGNLAGSANDIRLKISAMMGLLQVHLAAEDKSLYPAMLGSADEKAKTTAKRFLDEMGGLGKTVAEHNARWTAAYISSSNGFAREWQAVLKALGDRVQRENAQLYPLADAL